MTSDSDNDAQQIIDISIAEYKNKWNQDTYLTQKTVGNSLTQLPLQTHIVVSAPAPIKPQSKLMEDLAEKSLIVTTLL